MSDISPAAIWFSLEVTSKPLHQFLLFRASYFSIFVNVIALRAGPSDGSLYTHQQKSTLVEFLIPPNSRKDLSLWGQEFWLLFLSGAIRKTWTFELLLIHAPVGGTITTPFLTLDLITLFPVLYTCAVGTLSAIMGNKLLSWSSPGGLGFTQAATDSSLFVCLISPDSLFFFLFFSFSVIPAHKLKP